MNVQYLNDPLCRIFSHVIDSTMKDSMEVKAVDPLKWLSKSTLKDFEPDSLVYESWDRHFKDTILSDYN